MVLRVALRTLQNEPDAEDVFQATFLVLSQKSQSLRRQASLGSWLHGVAYRLALKTKSAAGERRNRERCVEVLPVATPLTHITVQEAQAILDDEIGRMPEKLRGPLVLCCLEGLARDEAATQIGCSASVLKSRLEQGRERLRHRLIARGLTMPCGFGAFLLLENAAAATVPPGLIVATAKAAICIAAGKAASTVVTAKVAALTDGVVQTMFLTNIKTVTVPLIVCMLVLGTGLVTYRTLAAQSEKPPVTAKQPEAPQRAEQEKEGFTAWGQEIGGLQAGLGFRPGERRAYHHGETVILVVRVRNVGKETVKFAYIKQFLDEEPPTVTDANGKKVSQASISVTGLLHAPVEVSLASGKEIVLESRIDGAAAVRHQLSPLGERGGGGSRGRPLYGIGKVKIHYERVFGSTSAGRLKLDPELSKLSTGTLDLEIKPALPIDKKPPQQQDKQEGFTSWGKEIGGLQAGLGFHSGQKRTLAHGDTVTLVVRIRNVGKETIKFSYLQPFIEHALIVTDGAEKPVPQPSVLPDVGEHQPGELELAPGKEIELHEVKRQLRPVSESGSKKFMRPYALYGTGTLKVAYEQVLGDPSLSTPGWTLDPTLTKLATGKLEIAVESDPP